MPATLRKAGSIGENRCSKCQGEAQGGHDVHLVQIVNTGRNQRTITTAFLFERIDPTQK